jgi:hypothetical protein
MILIFIPIFVHSTVVKIDRGINDYKSGAIYKFAKFLESKSLDYGYAGPWDTDVLSVDLYTGGKVHISLIDLNPLQAHLHSDKSWYWRSSHQGKTFIAIPISTPMTSPKLLRVAHDAISHSVFEQWSVFVYNHNPTEIIGAPPPKGS